jgi:hypothetical protein
MRWAAWSPSGRRCAVPLHADHPAPGERRRTAWPWHRCWRPVLERSFWTGSPFGGRSRGRRRRRARRRPGPAGRAAPDHRPAPDLLGERWPGRCARSLAYAVRTPGAGGPGAAPRGLGPEGAAHLGHAERWLGGPSTRPRRSTGGAALPGRVRARPAVMDVQAWSGLTRLQRGGTSGCAPAPQLPQTEAAGSCSTSPTPPCPTPTPGPSPVPARVRQRRPWPRRPHPHRSGDAIGSGSSGHRLPLPLLNRRLRPGGPGTCGKDAVGHPGRASLSSPSPTRPPWRRRQPACSRFSRGGGTAIDRGRRAG